MNALSRQDTSQQDLTVVELHPISDGFHYLKFPPNERFSYHHHEESHNVEQFESKWSHDRQ